jgi:hypothetical protein
MGASVCVSLQVSTGDPTAPSICSYFGSAATHSPAGKRLAELAAEELALELGWAVNVVGLTAAILRETRMPAVQIDTRPADPIGPAIAAALSRFFAG